MPEDTKQIYYFLRKLRLYFWLEKFYNVRLGWL